jgi:hypothetical protein
MEALVIPMELLGEMMMKDMEDVLSINNTEDPRTVMTTIAKAADTATKSSPMGVKNKVTDVKSKVTGVRNNHTDVMSQPMGVKKTVRLGTVRVVTHTVALRKHRAMAGSRKAPAMARAAAMSLRAMVTLVIVRKKTLDTADVKNLPAMASRLAMPAPDMGHVAMITRHMELSA